MLGLELVRALAGGVEAKSAVNGVLVTTSWPAKPAKTSLPATAGLRSSTASN